MIVCVSFSHLFYAGEQSFNSLRDVWMRPPSSKQSSVSFLSSIFSSEVSIACMVNIDFRAYTATIVGCCSRPVRSTPNTAEQAKSPLTGVSPACLPWPPCWLSPATTCLQLVGSVPVAMRTRNGSSSCMAGAGRRSKGLASKNGGAHVWGR